MKRSNGSSLRFFLNDREVELYDMFQLAIRLLPFKPDKLKHAEHFSKGI